MAIESMIGNIVPWIKQFGQTVIVIFFGVIFIGLVGAVTYLYRIWF